MQSESTSESAKAGTSGAREASENVSEAFIANRSKIKRFLSRFLANKQDIEDVLQETYLRARGAERTQKIVSPKAFLYRIARNEALRELQRASRRIVDLVGAAEDLGDVDDANVLERSALATEQFGLFCRSTLEMPPQCRRVFLMCKVYGYSYAEIAATLEISLSAVEKHVSKGLQVTHKFMQQNSLSDNARLQAPSRPTPIAGLSRPLRALDNKRAK